MQVQGKLRYLTFFSASIIQMGVSSRYIQHSSVCLSDYIDLYLSHWLSLRHMHQNTQAHELWCIYQHNILSVFKQEHWKWPVLFDITLWHPCLFILRKITSTWFWEVCYILFSGSSMFYSCGMPRFNVLKFLIYTNLNENVISWGFFTHYSFWASHPLVLLYFSPIARTTSRAH